MFRHRANSSSSPAVTLPPMQVKRRGVVPTFPDNRRAASLRPSFGEGAATSKLFEGPRSQEIAPSPEFVSTGSLFPISTRPIAINFSK